METGNKELIRNNKGIADDRADGKQQETQLEVIRHNKTGRKQN